MVYVNARKNGYRGVLRVLGSYGELSEEEKALFSIKFTAILWYTLASLKTLSSKTSFFHGPTAINSISLRLMAIRKIIINLLCSLFIFNLYTLLFF